MEYLHSVACSVSFQFFFPRLLSRKKKIVEDQGGDSLKRNHSPTNMSQYYEYTCTYIAHMHYTYSIFTYEHTCQWIQGNRRLYLPRTEHFHTDLQYVGYGISQEFYRLRRNQNCQIPFRQTKRFFFLVCMLKIKSKNIAGFSQSYSLCIITISKGIYIFHVLQDFKILTTRIQECQ